MERRFTLVHMSILAAVAILATTLVYTIWKKFVPPPPPGPNTNSILKIRGGAMMFRKAKGYDFEPNNPNADEYCVILGDLTKQLKLYYFESGNDSKVPDDSVDLPMKSIIHFFGSNEKGDLASKNGIKVSIQSTCGKTGGYSAVLTPENNSQFYVLNRNGPLVGGGRSLRFEDWGCDGYSADQNGDVDTCEHPRGVSVSTTPGNPWTPGKSKHDCS